jgi:hypothetical protein
VARVLIVGCGCRGRELAWQLVADGHAARGTTRRPEDLSAIESTGAEAAVADPDRLSTLLPLIGGVSVICWLMGTAVGEPEVVAAIHGARLESLLGRLVDSPVRGFVYEAAGRVPRRRLDEGASIVRKAAATYRMPVAVVETDPADRGQWLAAMRAAVDRVLAPTAPR